MRMCPRCQCEMVENCDIRVEGAGYGVIVTRTTDLFAERLGKPKVAICPKCGEVSIYIENVERLTK